MRLTSMLLCPALCSAAIVTADLSEVRDGPIRVAQATGAVVVQWHDERAQPWKATFSLDSEKPLIAAIEAGGEMIVREARPVYRCDTGIRRRGWDAFFDYPPSHPQGTQSHQGRFRLATAKVRTDGNRAVLEFDGFEMGPFRGQIRYTFFPGSRLIQQEAVAASQSPDLAYLYEAGFEFQAPADRRPGGNMATEISYVDTHGSLQTERLTGLGPERQPLRVRYRSAAAKTEGGSLAAFPAPHQYFSPRDFTSNVGNLWVRSWRGVVGLGIRQLPDTNWQFYPWMNAPPGASQHMSLFLLASRDGSESALRDVQAFTRSDRFPVLAGYQTFAPHWHLAYTMQALENGPDWEPPFWDVLKKMGVNAAMIMDFHGDGHPRDLTELRLKELQAFYQACRRQSGGGFLLIPAEEANVHLGGHWSVAFPKEVLWWMDRAPGRELVSQEPTFGKVYSTGSAEDVLEMVRRERGYMYQTHPRTKGSTGYPDKILDTPWFRDPRYWGAGWKAMPSDLSINPMGQRSVRLLDDLSSKGFHKRLMGEVDVFQFDETHELYAHMNINYVRLPSLPDFDHYGDLLQAVDAGEFFVTTGEIVLPAVRWRDSAEGIAVEADAQWTFPLAAAELVWGDGDGKRHTVRQDLTSLNSFGSGTLKLAASGAPATGWRWARLAVWDVAGNCALVNPHWKDTPRTSSR